MSLWSRMANRFIKRLVPPVNTNWFTEHEAAHESWEPHELTDAATPLACVSVTPAAPASARGGGHLDPDVELLLDDVDRFFDEINP